MHIECKQHREGGSHIELDKTTYHFAPQPDGAHVSLVENPAHQDILLGIPEGFRVYRGEHKPAAAATVAELGLAPAGDEGDEPKDDATAGLLGSDEHESNYIIHGKDYALGDIVAAAHTASGLSVEEWNDLAAETRADLIDAELEKINAAGPVEAEAPKKSGKKK